MDHRTWKIPGLSAGGGAEEGSKFLGLGDTPEKGRETCQIQAAELDKIPSFPSNEEIYGELKKYVEIIMKKFVENTKLRVLIAFPPSRLTGLGNSDLCSNI